MLERRGGHGRQIGGDLRPGSGVIARGPAALDAEIDGLTRLRTELAMRTFGQP